MIKKIWYYMRLWDGFWSIPLSFLLYIVFSIFTYKYFGDALLSIEFLQPLFLSAIELISINFIIFLGCYFNFRSLQSYFYSFEIKKHVQNTLTTWQRIKLYLFVYFGLAFVMLVLLILNMLLITA